MRIFLIRHGATFANKEHRYLGKTDQSLSPEGIEALKEKKDAGMYQKVDALFSSPMKRCLETAKLLFPYLEPVMIPEWEEIDFGIFEGKNYEELKEDDRYQAWIDSHGTLPFPEGESREQFIRRCEQGFYNMLSKISECDRKHREPSMDIGCILHGGTIMALLSMFYGGDYFDYQVANGLGYRCRLTCKEKVIRFQDAWMLAHNHQALHLPQK